ncbi:MAG: aminotransferase class V-fold PLP-dependent enzyme [Clostridiaceae bacterium]|nr:aminotransferase class V-fold PLP-dependent enzyme [Clostridiaceae bacterium]
MLNWELLEKEYPKLNETAYLNSSAISLVPKRVAEAVNTYLGTLEADFCHSFNSYHDKIEKEAREELAKLIQCSPDEIAFTKNTCDGITLFANAYPFKAGDNVVITNQEYPSNFYPWLALERKGVMVKVAEFHDDTLYPEDVLALCDENTKVVSLSTVFFCNGFKFDVKTLGRELHKRGILLVVDSIQGLGRLNVIPREMNIDVLSNGGHKCLLGMKGAGFLYCDKKLVRNLIPHTACRQSLVRWHRPPLERHYDELPWKEGAQIFESGNPNYIGILAMGKGVSLLNELGIDEIEKHVLLLENYLRKKIAHLPLKINTPPSKEQYSGIVFVMLPEKAAAGEADEILLKHKVYATVREGYIRICIHCMNTEEHMDRAAAAFEEIATIKA